MQDIQGERITLEQEPEPDKRHPIFGSWLLSEQIECQTT
jgi:hypothetical protein